MLLLLACVEGKDSLTGADSVASTDLLPVTVEEGPEVACADPARRAESAFDRQTSPAWAAQRDASTGDPGGGIAAGDLDGDGSPEIYLPSWQQDRLFTGLTAPELLPLAAESVIGESAVLGDVDGDGDLDVILGNRAPARLLRNDGAGGLTSEEAGIAPVDAFHVGGTLGDVDGDGDLDLFLATHLYGPASPEYIASGEFPPPDPNALYLNDGDGTFTDASDRLPEEAIHAPTYAAALIDLDGDADLDLYLVNDFGRYVQPNLALWNDGAGGFTAATGTGLEIALCGMGLSAADWNGDGAPDLLVSGWDELRLLLSDGAGGWYEGGQAMGLYTDGSDGRHVAWGSAAQDFDNDGDTDAFVGYGMLQMPPEEQARFEELVGWPNPADQPDALFILDGGQFTQRAESFGPPPQGIANPRSTHGVLAADLDGDGWVDLLTRAMDGDAEIWLARCGGEGWLTVDLDQPGANPDGVGAQIGIEVGGARQLRWIQAGGQGVGSGGPPVAHFGLGAAEQADRLFVIWPDGQRSEVGPIRGRRHITIRRG